MKNIYFLRGWGIYKEELDEKKNTAGGIHITKINNILFDFSKNF